MKPMEYLVTGEEMQRYDSNTISHFKVPALILMEQAALAATEEIIKLVPSDNPSEDKTVLVLAGKGNNGGDAMAVARLLAQKGYQVTTYIVSNHSFTRSDFSHSAGVQYDILQAMNLPLVPNLPIDSYDIIIDGIFGVGLNREISGVTSSVIEQINTYHGLKISLDIPSGIHADNGSICGIAFQADYTITFGFLKRGLFMTPGAKYAGQIIKKEIGITTDSFLDCPPKMYALTGDVKDYLPPRDTFGHKGTFGKILLIAGNKTIGGAAILAGKAAMMSGCGMLRICTHKEQKHEILTSIPEAMLDIYSTMEEAVECVQKGLEWADIIAMGPGMGTDGIASILFKTVIENSRKPLVLDADALNLLALPFNYSLVKKLQASKDKKRDIILTPHPLELSRICGCQREAFLEKGLEIAHNLAKELHCIVIKKDARTVVCSEEESYIINLRGNSGMATAGSGDVLTGIVAALLALKLPSYKAAALGVYIHALAGDEAAWQKNEYSMLAGDICNALIPVLK